VKRGGDTEAGTTAAKGLGSKGLGSKGQRTRHAVLDAAIRRFGRDGYKSTSIADIARDAGVGGSVAYAYFANKEALFIAALEEDATALINEGLAQLIAQPDVSSWRDRLIGTLVDAMRNHPLVQRVLAGHEPEVTDRVIELPALARLREAVVDRIRADQAAGIVRPDIDPVRIGNGATTIILTMLMAVLQFEIETVAVHIDSVWAVFDAALDPPGTNR
jgi:AcrR family transcriptional regulator